MLETTLIARMPYATSASAKLTSGPASAVSSSCSALRGSAASEAHPPRSESVISRVRYPNARATRAWPISCSVTETASTIPAASPKLNEWKSVMKSSKRTTNERFT